MPDFSDGYFEELRKKIRFITDHQDSHSRRQKLSSSKEEEEEKGPIHTGEEKSKVPFTPAAPRTVALPFTQVAIREEEQELLSPSEKDKEKEPLTTTPDQTCVVEQPVNGQNNAIIFSLKNQVTGLVRALRVFQVHFSFIILYLILSENQTGST